MTLLDGGCLAGRIIPDDYRTLPRFLIEQLSRCPGGYHTALEFGCGPALYTALSFAPSVRRLHVADYLAGNRAEVRRWLASVRPLVSTQVYESGTVPRMTSARFRWKRDSGGVTPPW